MENSQNMLQEEESSILENKLIIIEEKDSKKKKSFAEGLNFYKLFWIFMFGAFLGVVMESIVCIIELQRLESRAGVLYGPFNPVYGLGAVLITVMLNGVKEKNNSFIFIISMIMGAAFEFLCSYVQEKMFGTVSWQYSNMFMNFAGRTSLFYALCWGTIGICWIRFIYPAISKLIEKVPNKIGLPVSKIIITLMIFNMIISIMAATREDERREGIPASSTIDHFLDKHYDSQFMQKVYPNAHAVREN